jgi:hypothetical protein
MTGTDLYQIDTPCESAEITIFGARLHFDSRPAVYMNEVSKPEYSFEIVDHSSARFPCRSLDIHKLIHERYTSNRLFPSDARFTRQNVCTTICRNTSLFLIQLIFLPAAMTTSTSCSRSGSDRTPTSRTSCLSRTCTAASVRILRSSEARPPFPRTSPSMDSCMTSRPGASPKCTLKRRPTRVPRSR